MELIATDARRRRMQDAETYRITMLTDVLPGQWGNETTMYPKGPRIVYMQLLESSKDPNSTLNSGLMSGKLLSLQEVWIYRHLTSILIRCVLMVL
jgi:hypothetical protein